MTPLKNKLLLASVFATGASVLIIEIVAIRVLAPYYGNTIYTTSSVIGVILAALSLGYYLGGIFSDQYPDYRLFYLLVAAGGLLIVLMQILSQTFLPFLSALFSIVSGPFISALILFFIPAFILGTLSPFAVKLNHCGEKEVNGIGKQSGQVFFWSTLGSIAGSFLAGFVLIPNFGISSIVFGTGIVLSLWGLTGFFFFAKQKRKTLVLFILLVALEFLLINLIRVKSAKEVVYERDGVYQRIKISDGVWNGRPARFLFQDKNYSAAMYLDSQELAFEYTGYYRLYKLFNQEPKNAFIIGGGAYSIPKDFLKDSSSVQIDVAEIEPGLFELAQKYFNLQNSERLKNYVEDGRRFLNNTPKKYDVIVADVYYSLLEIPLHFTTKEFFSLAKSKLSDKGVFVGNFAGALDRQSSPLLFSEIKTFRQVFPNSYFFAVVSPKIATPQNIIFLGTTSSKNIDFKGREVLGSSEQIISYLGQKNISLDDFKLSEYREITDNFAPIEYLTSKVINKWYR